MVFSSIPNTFMLTVRRCIFTWSHVYAHVYLLILYWKYKVSNASYQSIFWNTLKYIFIFTRTLIDFCVLYFISYKLMRLYVRDFFIYIRLKSKFIFSLLWRWCDVFIYFHSFLFLTNVTREFSFEAVFRPN